MVSHHCLCLHIPSPLCTLLYPQSLWWGQQHGGHVPQIQEDVHDWLQIEVGASLSKVRRFGKKGLTTFAICIQNATFIPPYSHVLLILIHYILLCMCLCCLHCCFCHLGCSPCSLLILLKLVLLLQLMDQLLELWGIYNCALPSNSFCLAISCVPWPC